MTDPKPAPSPRPRVLIPFYKNARHGKLTNAQIIALVGIMFAVGLLALAYVGYELSVQANATQAATDRAQRAADQTEKQRKEGRQQRLESERKLRLQQDRLDLELARLACITIRYEPRARRELERSLSPKQRALIQDCETIAVRPTPSQTEPASPSVPPPTTRSGPSAPRSSPAGPGPSVQPTPRGPRPAPTPSRDAAPRPPGSTSPKPSPPVNLGPVLCGLLGIECRSGA